jgi:uncharacterized protein YcbK (DUF882 family)
MAWLVAPNRKASPHFHMRELACRHCGRISSVSQAEKLAAFLEEIRDRLGDRVMHVNSGFRCVVHNKAVGGEPNSFHVSGLAADIVVRGLSPSELWRQCRSLQQEGIIGGLGRYRAGFVHVDMGPRRNWTG